MFIKIFTAGHEVPKDDTILNFKRAVQRFLRDNADNGGLLLSNEQIFEVVGRKEGRGGQWLLRFY